MLKVIELDTGRIMAIRPNLIKEIQDEDGFANIQMESGAVIKTDNTYDEIYQAYAVV